MLNGDVQVGMSLSRDLVRGIGVMMGVCIDFCLSFLCFFLGGLYVLSLGYWFRIFGYFILRLAQVFTVGLIA